MEADITLLSESAIGSPAAFSTAIKPPLVSTSRSQRAHSSLPQLLHNQSSTDDGLTGCLSLGSSLRSPGVDMEERGRTRGDESAMFSPSEEKAKSWKTTGSLNESSVGILDLDAMRSDSSEGQLFLTSPHGSSHGLHLHLSPTFSNHSTHTSDHTSSRARITNELVRPSSVGSIRSSAHNRTKGLMGSALISTKAPIISAGGNVYGTTYALSKPSAPVITISMDTSVQPSAPVISSGVAISMDTETQPLTPVISGSTTSSIQPSAPLVSGTTISMDTATQSSTPVISGTTISKDTATHPVVSGNSISIDTATQPLTPVISGNTSFNSSNVPTAPVLTIPNESTNQLSIVGSSLGLPSELLGGRLSMNSAGSSSFASFSEGDTVQSALASALALHETSGGGVLSSSTVPPSLESSAITSLSQLTGQDLHGKRHREHGVAMGVVGDEPTIMKEAEKWSQYNPSHLDSTPKCPGPALQDESTSPQSSPTPGPNSSQPLSASESLEGLPSTYLHLQNSTLGNEVTSSTIGNETTDISSLYSSHSCLDPVEGTDLGTTLVSSSLPSSLTELVRKEEISGGSGGIYNPFNSDDSVSSEQVNFEEQNQGSFLAQLEKDEEDIKKFNSTSSTRTVSFDQHTPFSGEGKFADSSGEVSIASYFQKKSNAMGDIVTDRLSPNQRPHFSDSPSHTIMSPNDDTLVATPTSSADVIKKATPTDPTRTDADVRVKEEGSSTSCWDDSLPTLPQIIGTSLIPVVSDHTSFRPKLGIPKFSLRETFSPADITCRTSLLDTDSQPPTSIDTNGSVMSQVGTTFLTSSKLQTHGIRDRPVSTELSTTPLSAHRSAGSVMSQVSTAFPISHDQLPPSMHKIATTGDMSVSTESSAINLSVNIATGLSSMYLKPNIDSFSDQSLSLSTPTLCSGTQLNFTDGSTDVPSPSYLASSAHCDSTDDSTDVPPSYQASSVHCDSTDDSTDVPPSYQASSVHCDSTDDSTDVVPPSYLARSVVGAHHDSTDIALPSYLARSVTDGSTPSSYLAKSLPEEVLGDSLLTKMDRNGDGGSKGIFEGHHEEVHISMASTVPITMATMPIVTTTSTECIHTVPIAKTTSELPHSVKSPFSPSKTIQGLSEERMSSPPLSMVGSSIVNDVRQKLAKLRDNLEETRMTAEAVLMRGKSEGRAVSAADTVTVNKYLTEPSSVAEHRSMETTPTDIPFSITTTVTSSSLTSHTVPILTSHTVPILTSHTVPILTSHTVPILTSSTFHTSHTFTPHVSSSSLTSHTIPILTSHTVPILTSSTFHTSHPFTPHASSSSLTSHTIPILTSPILTSSTFHTVPTITTSTPHIVSTLTSSTVSTIISSSLSSHTVPPLPSSLTPHTVSFLSISSSSLTSHTVPSLHPLTVSTSQTPSTSKLSEGIKVIFSPRKPAKHPNLQLTPERGLLTDLPTTPTTKEKSLSSCHLLSSPLSNAIYNQLMYTSPALHTTLTTSPPLQSEYKLTGSNSLNVSGLRVPVSHLISEVCCVGSSVVDHFSVTNSGDRWMQLKFSVSRVCLDGQLIEEDHHTVYTLPERSLISPNQSEIIKVVFHPCRSGDYETVISVYASHMTSSDYKEDQPTATFVLKSTAEDPQIELCPCHTHTKSDNLDILDYGVLVGGSTTAISLELRNKGQGKLPLKLSITSENPLMQMYFSFRPLPQSLLLSSPPTSHVPSHSLTLTLPPSEPLIQKTVPHSIQICFTSPHKYLTDMTSNPGPPEVVSAQLEVRVDGTHAQSSLLLRTMLLRAVVGVARLYVPRALQAVSLSCTVGHAVTRDVPIKNIGNIPLKVRLDVGGVDHTHFTVSPCTLHMEPQEESKVSVCFDPPSAPLISEGLLEIHIEPGGPRHELKLRGTAIEPPTPKKGMLTCNRHYLYWGGVSLGDSKQLKLLLHNSFPFAIPLKLSIRHPQSPFQLEQDEMILLPQEESCVVVTFYPFSTSVSISALDIFDTLHSKKYRVPLCGYGGVSRLEVGGVNSSDGQQFLDIGEVRGNCGIKLKVLLYNSGPRAAFVRAVCQQLEASATLPEHRARIVPSNLVILPHSTGELLLFYHPSPAEEERCEVSKNPLAQLLIHTGDEIVRQCLTRVVKEGREGRKKEGEVFSLFIQEFVEEFFHQDKVTADLELAAFQLDNIEKLFSDHLTTMSVTLMGSPKHTPKPFRTALRYGQTGYGSITPQGAGLLPLSPSYTPVENVPKASVRYQHHHHTFNILSTLLINFPKVQVHHSSESFLEVMNPFPESLHWELSSALPFVRQFKGRAISKADYSAFTISIKSGTVLPNSKVKVPVVFLPCDEGSFSQLWTLKVSGPVSLKDKHLKISFSGEAENTISSSPQTKENHTLVQHATDNLPPSNIGSHDQLMTSCDQPLKSRDPVLTSHYSQKQHIAKWLSQTRHNQPLLAKKTKKTVYLSEELIRFPEAKVGDKLTVKVRVCNRDSVGHDFEVLKPSSPFSVDHLTFKLESRQCARLPVHFSPKYPGDYEGILALQTHANHQTFTQLRGKAST